MTKKDPQAQDDKKAQQATQGQAQGQDDAAVPDELQQKIKALEEEQQKEAMAAEQKLQAQDAAQKQIDELKNHLARCLADLQNYKRRTEEERLKWIHVAQIDLLREILPLLNNFDRAAQHLPENLKEDNWVKGVIQIHDELMKKTEKLGIKKIPTVGQKIDPTRHEAVMGAAGEKDVILKEFEAGYLLNDMVIKPARVSVGNGEAASASS